MMGVVIKDCLLYVQAEGCQCLGQCFSEGKQVVERKTVRRKRHSCCPSFAMYLALLIPA